MKYKINKKAQNILKRYIANGGNALFWEQLPFEVTTALDDVDKGEQLYNETTRFLGDNIKVNYFPNWG